MLVGYATVLLFIAVAVVFNRLGPFAFVEGLIFIAILVVGLAYVWAKGDLAWVKPEDVARAADSEKAA